MYPHTRGCVSMCMRPSIQAVMYQHGHTVDLCVEFCYALWAITQNMVNHYEPVRVWLCTIGQCSESLTNAQKHMNFIPQLAASFKGIVRQRIVTYILHSLRHRLCLKPFLAQKKWYCSQWAIVQNEIPIWYLGKFEVQCKTALGFKIGAQVESSDKNN